MTEDTLPDFLAAWMPQQRWYGNKSRAPVIRGIGSWTLESAEAGALIRTHLVLDTATSEPVLYQVPITERTVPLAEGDSALIAQAGLHYYYDAPHDPAYANAVLKLIREDGRSPANATHAYGHALSTVGLDPVYLSRVLSGEQSNTSIIFEPTGRGPGRAIICKLFRVLHPGENPDVVVQSALAASGSRFVSRPIGFVTGEWDGPGHTAEHASGHLAFAQEFLPDAPDAWRVALRAAEAGDDFSARARTLGEATADVHASLAAVMPTEEADARAIAGIVDGMLARYRVAQRDVPALAEHQAAIEATFTAARNAPWPRLQRIHGDYHLGQVLNAPGRGWVLIDFEGEPLRPLTERRRPDVTLRDVAGMLRSFSYVGGSLARAHPGGLTTDVAGWVSACRQAFLDGYAARSGQDLRRQRVLLDAFELDKAIYESRYEALNRPAWLPVPLAAVRRLVAQRSSR